MDLHVYRNSQDRWYDLKSTARERGAVLALNAVTLDELVQRLTPDLQTATAGQRLAIVEKIANKEAREPEARRQKPEAEMGSEMGSDPSWKRELSLPMTSPSREGSDPISASGFSPRYVSEAISDLKSARVWPAELRAAGVAFPPIHRILDHDESCRARHRFADERELSLQHLPHGQELD